MKKCITIMQKKRNAYNHDRLSFYPNFPLIEISTHVRGKLPIYPIQLKCGFRMHIMQSRKVTGTVKFYDLRYKNNRERNTCFSITVGGSSMAYIGVWQLPSQIP